MSPLGKFTFAVIGLRFFGASGFFVGMLLGHLLIDRTVIIKQIERGLHAVDDNIRILLPYRWYRYYNRLDGNFWGKIWGTLFGSILFGFYGFITLFIVGHFTFDPPNSRHANKFRKNFDIFWNRNWCKIFGAIIGFILHSRIILFSGIIIGYFLDSFRLERSFYKGFGLSWLPKFWRKINPLKLAGKRAKLRSFRQLPVWPPKWPNPTAVLTRAKSGYLRKFLKSPLTRIPALPKSSMMPNAPPKVLSVIRHN